MGFFILGSLTYLLFFSSLFQITNIEISKINNYNLASTGEIKQTIYSLLGEKSCLFLPGSNLFAFGRGELEKKLSGDSRIEEYQISKDWPKTLQITIKESRPQAILVIQGYEQKYLLNSRGEIIPGWPEETVSQLKLPIFYDSSSVSLSNEAYQRVVDQILTCFQSDPWKQAAIEPVSVYLNNYADIFEIRIITQEGWEIILDSETDLQEQVENMVMALEKKIEDRSQLKYIDLRFKGKMFYKLKEEQETSLTSWTD